MRTPLYCPALLEAGRWQCAFCVLFAVIVGLVPVFSTSAQQIEVMQWNIRHGLGITASNSTPQAAAIARVVNYNQPDVLLFNEVLKDTVANNQAALTVWVTNNLPYMGTQPGVTFFVAVSTVDDFFIRNAAISRYPISNETNDDDGLRGLHGFRIQLSGTNVLQIFHAHFKCCSDMQSDCDTRQSNAVFSSNKIRTWAVANLAIPYIFAGDWNEDEANPQCPLTTTYRPITMVRTNGNLVQFIPANLDGGTKTISTPSPTRRFDYCLAGSNRLSAVSGYVFNSVIWAQHGLYTNASLQNLASDSTTASDHCSVFVKYSFPTSVTNFTVTPTNAFTSSGNEGGGPFSPSSQVYTLTNTDTIPLFWSVTKTSSWLTVSTLATNLTLGAGAGTNITATINSSANSLFAGTYVDTINFSNTATSVSFSRGVTLTVNAAPPSASFTGSPTTGTNSLVVTFSDTSTGSITNRFWDFGDSSPTNVTTNSVTHTYAGGIYTVTLIASGPLGVSTNTKPNYITVVLPPTTILADAGNLFDSTTNNLAPINSVAVLVVDTGNNGFADPQPSFAVSLGATWGTDDRVVGLWDLTACQCGDGELFDQTVVAYTNGILPGQRLQLYWFPSLTLASNTVGVTHYGKYTDTNSPPLDGSDEWMMPVGGSSVHLRFLTAFWSGSNPETAGLATLLTAEPTAFESWQIQYFGDTNNAAAASSADPDGDGQNNLAEFLAGTDPTNNASGLRITAVAKEGNDVRLTWRTANGKTNAVQASAGASEFSYTNSFVDVSPAIVILGSGDPVTNFLDEGATTNGPARYYRIRLVQ